MQLLGKSQPWKWSKDFREAFYKLKERLVLAQGLVYYDSELSLRLACDASAYGIAAVLSHTMPDGSKRPIANGSRTLSKAEQHYSQIEKEAFSLTFGVKTFHRFPYGRAFTLVTDHKALTTVFGSKKGIPKVTGARLQIWAILLMAYTYQIEYR